MTIRSSEAAKLFDGAKAGPIDIAVTVYAPAMAERPVKIRNVAGVLRGSDPVLKDTYVLVTAHYDHLGMLPGGEGDTVYNGANDDGSGTVSVMEIAGALGRMPKHPKRSILFMTFFGEEKGMLGSRYYGKHPLVPIEKTVADVNLEQIGRTDDSQGPQIAAASLTGFDYTDVGPIFQAAGEAVGVTVSKRSPMSDAYFGRSDNQALADQGVPAHTLCVAYEYPDYHGLGDHWEKVDYANMAKIDRMVALGLVTIANNPAEPKWNESNPRTQRYVQAWKERRK
jgi:Zn-dependent M28 family amino/carboxypeptidase